MYVVCILYIYEYSSYMMQLAFTNEKSYNKYKNMYTKTIAKGTIQYYKLNFNL